jgi:hypothetical protein
MRAYHADSGPFVCFPTKCARNKKFQLAKFLGTWGAIPYKTWVKTHVPVRAPAFSNFSSTVRTSCRSVERQSAINGLLHSSGSSIWFGYGHALGEKAEKETWIDMTHYESCVPVRTGMHTFQVQEPLVNGI